VRQIGQFIIIQYIKIL